jgi:DNA-binding NarL/FixJ family response regulator
MVAQPGLPTCVLLGDLEPMARVGMARLLTENGIQIVDGTPPGALVEAARRFRPDAIVIGLGDSEPTELSAGLRDAAPEAKVILWARDETEMQVLDPGDMTPRRVRAAGPDALLNELIMSHADRGRE